MKNYTRSAVLGIALLLIASGCATEGYNKGDFNLMSHEQEDEWGDQLQTKVNEELRKKDSMYENRMVNDYLDRLGKELLANAEEIHFDYSFTPVKMEAVNAFAIPAGHIYIHTGLIAAAESEAELTGVMAHEIGHVVARHGSERMSAMIAATTVGNILIGSQDEAMNRMLTDLAVQIVTTGGMLAYSRAAENEADKIGTKIMYRTGYNPYGMVSFFEKLHEKTGDMSQVEVFLSTHPSPESRMENIREYIKEKYPDAGDRTKDSETFYTVRSICRGISYPEREKK